ncbi:hypothetical protein AB0O05_14620 [Streptomyces sp. NPDC093084]|uniref:hypothetical protein n=1 Tax=Streptomyces sp. NPDC093084 TaxID=3155197 RepID=UPI00342E5B70
MADEWQRHHVVTKVVEAVDAFYDVQRGVAILRDSELDLSDTLHRNAMRMALEGLTDHDADRRDLAVSALGDLLRGAAFDDRSAPPVVELLVRVAVHEPVTTVRESALNSISEAFQYHNVALTTVRPLAAAMPTMESELLACTLYIFGATHDPRACPLIDPFLGHPDRDVREEAERAKAEITASGRG